MQEEKSAHVLSLQGWGEEVGKRRRENIEEHKL